MSKSSVMGRLRRRPTRSPPVAYGMLNTHAAGEDPDAGEQARDQPPAGVWRARRPGAGARARSSYVGKALFRMLATSGPATFPTYSVTTGTNWLAASGGIPTLERADVRPDILAAEPAAVVAFATWDADGE